MSDTDGFQSTSSENPEDHSTNTVEDRFPSENVKPDSPVSEPSQEKPSQQYYSPLSAPQYQQASRPPYQQPVPPYQQPAPPYQQPAPPYQQPAPPYQQPVLPYQQPAPSYQQPAPSYQQPMPPYLQQPVYAPPYYSPVYPVRQAGEGIATASLVLGILSIIFCYIPFLDVILALLALILGIVAKVKGNGGMAIAGIVLGIFGLLLSALILFFIFSPFLSSVKNFNNNFTEDFSNFTAAFHFR